MLQWLRAREARLARLLAAFVRIESPSYDAAAINRLVALLSAEWKERGAKVQRLSAPAACKLPDLLRCEISAARGGAKGQILLLGHTDTVYERGALERMPCRITRGRVFGPGALDMKSGLVIALAALDALQAHGFAPRRRVVFLWTPDEEIGSKCSRAAIEREARRSTAVLVLEPGSGRRGKLKTARKGVGEFLLEVTGRAAHAGVNPQEGVNAVHELALQIARISRFGEPRRGITVNADVAQGGTRTNVIAERARAQVDVRCSFAADLRRIEARFRALRPILPGARLRVSGGMERPPLERRVSARLFEHTRALGRALGLRIEESSTGGGSDGNFTAALGVPTLDGLGGAGAGAHSPGEYVTIRSLADRAALLSALLLSL